MLKLFHAPQSRSSRILWLLEELKAACEIVYVDIARQDGSGGADPRNPHPDKKVPALVHDGALITESAAVVLYLTDLYPDAGIGPRVGSPARGPYLTWLAYYAGVIEPVVHFGFLGLSDNPALRRTFRGKEEMEARILGALKTHAYIAGESFTAADILVASLGHFMRDMLPAGKLVDDYLERCSSRPARGVALAKDSGPSS
jgi:glutathione S-transferase